MAQVSRLSAGAFGQSFTPTYSGLDAVEIDTYAFSPSSPVTGFAEIRELGGFDGLSGALLGTSSTVVLPANSGSGPVHFDFASTVALTPGDAYAIVLVTTPSTPSGNGWFLNLSSADPYSGGQALLSGNVLSGALASSDLVFTAGLHAVPLPSAGWLGLGLLGALGAVRLHRRRKRG